MSSFVLAFRNDPQVEASPAELDAWSAWFQQLGGAVTDMGSRIGKTHLLGADAGGNTLSGYTVIQADDLDHATRLASACPGLEHGGSVEIGEIIPM